MPPRARARAAEHAPAARAFLPPVPDPRSIEPEVLRRWRERDVFERSLAQTSDGPLWTCAGDPPAAGGLPGVHQLPDLAVRDLYQRYRTMRGFHVPRPLAWNCHGLAVEVGVERELGLNGRADIERYGIGRFAERCRESATRHVQAHSALIERIGHWVSLAGARETMNPGYVEFVWACVHRLFTDGLLARRERVAPYCPRCQTNLADHELARPASFRQVTEDVVTVRFPVTALPDGMNPWLGGADLLATTTASWTLMANAAIAVHPHQTYAVARRAGHGDRVVVADAAVGRVLGEGWHVVARFSGADLAGLGYLPPFGPAAGHRVVTGHFVTVEAGTGLAHLAPAFGADDLAACRTHGLSLACPIGPDGRFAPDLPLVGGVFFMAAGRVLTEALADRALLFASERTERGRPHCWRCGTVLLSRALPAWYVRTSAASERLLAADRLTTWLPTPGKPGSDGGWLRCDTDWAVSRTRYWGTPLPIWECEQGHLTCVPSLARLSGLAGRDVTAIDPHRPAVDAVTFACPRCARTAHRVPDVLDSAFDAGVTHLDAGWPCSRPGRRPEPEAHAWQARRADLATETADEGGGWLYALMTAGALLTGQPPFSTALCLGSVLDSEGTAMSRDLGNVADPLPLIGRFGADALRWFCTAAAPPSAARRVTDAALGEVARKVLAAYWDCVVFFAGHADLTARSPRPGAADAPPPAARPPADRWLLSELRSVIADVTAAFDSVRSAAAGRRIAWFIDQLSGWCLRTNRHRFSDSQDAAGRAAALATLGDCLEVLTRLMAPVVPFITDYAWDVIRAAGAPDSVHLARWPVPAELSVSSIERPIADAGVAADQPLAGWAVAASDDQVVASDLQVTPGTRGEGLAREVIRLVTQARDADGIGPAERIVLRWSAKNDELASALAEFGPMISAGVMAAEYGPQAADEMPWPAGEAGTHHDRELGLSFWIAPLRP